jgi:hypothetical protein
MCYADCPQYTTVNGNVCVDQCDRRTPVVEMDYPCSIVCVLQEDNENCEKTCKNTNHYHSLNGQCVLISNCSQRIPVSTSTDLPCGDGCILGEDNNCLSSCLCPLNTIHFYNNPTVCSYDTCQQYSNEECINYLDEGCVADNSIGCHKGECLEFSGVFIDGCASSNDCVVVNNSQCMNNPCKNIAPDENNECSAPCVIKTIGQEVFCAIDSCLAFNLSLCEENHFDRCGMDALQEYCYTQECSYFNLRLII